MERPIIRKGDRTSHGGTVLEGSPFDICEGKQVAFVGHKVSCPKCSGTHQIIEGAPATMFYGKGVALAGMKTSCGATLIATQFVSTVEISSPVSKGGTSAESTKASVTPTSGSQPLSSNATAQDSANVEQQFDQFFLVQDESTGEAIANAPYQITLEDGTTILGVTDENGHTKKVFANSAAMACIEVPYHG